MEIRVLRYFLAVAREGSITAAANYLHLTQPTLSRQIHDLEAELGSQLLIRGSHRVTLTQHGVLFRKRAEEIISLVDKTEQEFTAMEDIIGGDIYIGGGETQAISGIAEIIKELGKTYPEIRYHMHSGNAQDVTDRLDNGLLDFGILIQPADISKYDYIRLPSKDVWGVLIRRDCPLAEKSAVEKEDLIGIPLICSRQVVAPDQPSNSFAQWFGSDYEKLNITATYNLVYNAAIMVKEGIGCAVTLDKLADTSEESGLCFRPLAPCLESGLNVVWKKYQVFSPAAQLFLDRLKEKYDK